MLYFKQKITQYMGVIQVVFKYYYKAHNIYGERVISIAYVN